MSAAVQVAPSGATAPTGIVYLLHFNRPYGHAKHYLGWTQNLPRRLSDHRKGYAGARLMEVVKAAGIDFELARTWENATRADERSKKARGKSRMCPICKQEHTAEEVAG